MLLVPNQLAVMQGVMEMTVLQRYKLTLPGSVRSSGEGTVAR
jgi:hypothetical protein